jgi:hypothetical protein
LNLDHNSLSTVKDNRSNRKSLTTSKYGNVIEVVQNPVKLGQYLMMLNVKAKQDEKVATASLMPSSRLAKVDRLTTNSNSLLSLESSQ